MLYFIFKNLNFIICNESSLRGELSKKDERKCFAIKSEMKRIKQNKYLIRSAKLTFLSFIIKNDKKLVSNVTNKSTRNLWEVHYQPTRNRPIWVQPIPIYVPGLYFCRYRYIWIDISATDTDIFPKLIFGR